jgi:hypothetical protein
MKKTLTLIGILTVGMALSHAQGLITLSASSALAFTNGASVSGKASGTSAFYFEVLDATDTTLAGTTANQIYGNSGNFALWTDSTVSGVNGTGLNAGHISNGSISAANNWAAAQSSSILSAPDSYIVVGWSANYGTSWAAVSSEIQSGTLANGGFFGVTAAGFQSAGGDGYSAVAVWGNPTSISNGGLNGANNEIVMNLVAPTPEPGTMALAALGGASLLLFRRRK